MRQSFYFGMLQGFLYYGSTLIWFTRIFGLAAISLFAILAFFVALFCLIACALKWRMRHPLIDAMLMATLWTGIEYYRSEWFPLHFSWATPGVTVGPDWFTPYVGAYGVSFLIVFAGVLFSRIRDIPLWNQTFAVLVCILLYFPLPKKYPVNPVRVIAVQKEDAPLEDYITATRKWRFYHPEFVVWPEYAIPEDIRRVRTDEKKIMQMVRDMKTVLVFGTRTDTGNRLGDWRNTALVVNPHGELGRYYKNRPVPLFQEGIPGTHAEPISTPMGTIGTPICFDNDFEEIDRKMVAKGAQLLLAPSMDEASWSRTEHLQHALQFRLRAAENRRWMLVASSSGLTEIIDPDGRMHGFLPMMQPGVLAGEVEMISARTFYNKIGWIGGPLCFFMSLFLITDSLFWMGLQRIARRLSHA